MLTQGYCIWFLSGENALCPIIRVEIFKGRSIDKIRDLVKILTDCFVKTLGGKPGGLQITIIEVDIQDMDSGGELCCDKYKT